MGKFGFIFLCFFIVVVCDRSTQSRNLNSSSTKNEIPSELQKRMRELENFYEEFKSFKSSFVELGAAFGRFHQSLTKNETGETGEVRSTTPSTPQQHENPALKSITSCSDAMKILPTPLSKKQIIYPQGPDGDSLKVLCDFEVDGGGWTLIQKRSSGPKREFNRNWTEYESGFGLRAGNFWLGLENIRALTQNGDQELRIELEDFEGEKRWAKYSSFSVSDASDFYRLSIGGFSGDVEDSMKPHNGMQFSTWDKDNDKIWGYHCAASHGGGWWFENCLQANLNGQYFKKGETLPWNVGILWTSWTQRTSSLAKTVMKIRTRK